MKDKLLADFLESMKTQFYDLWNIVHKHLDNQVVNLIDGFKSS